MTFGYQIKNQISSNSNDRTIKIQKVLLKKISQSDPMHHRVMLKFQTGNIENELILVMSLN